MSRISENIITPVRNFQVSVSSLVPFSIAELLMALVLIWIIVMLILRKWKSLLAWLLTGSLTVYALFCLLWGTYYYGEAAVQTDSISVEQLAAVAQYFADIANENYGPEPDRSAIIDKSAELYDNCGIKAKGIVCSKVMSLVDFTGFFFPLTGEANVNMDSPAHDLPATVAHELAHLFGVAREQEANFYAVKSSMEYGDREYVYSAALLAYTHLGNALYDEDYDKWLEIRNSLSEDVIADLRETSDYWGGYETPVSTVSNTVYEGFLYSYGQNLGLKSYGACVDLIVNYYYDVAISDN